MGTTVTFGRFLVPRSRLLLQRHPGLSLELVIRDGIADLIGERLDLAVRVGALSDSSLVARQCFMARRVAVASPAYLERRGIPNTPEDLQRHECLLHEEWHES